MIVQNTIRTILFLVMFSIGAAALGAAVLLDDIIRHYQSQDILRQQRQYSEKLRSLNEDYDALLRLIEEDPNSLKRIAPATVGADPMDPNAVYPRATAEALAAAKEALAEEAETEPNRPVMPAWITRVREGDRRLILYFAGAILVIISLTCFSPIRLSKDDDRRPRYDSVQT